MGAFTSTGATTGGVLIEQMYFRQYVSSVFNNGWLGLRGDNVGTGGFFPKVDWPTSYNWVIRRSNPDSEIFTEGQAQMATDSTDSAHCVVSPKYARSMVQISGHALDAMRSNYVNVNVTDDELSAAADAVADLLSTTLLTGTDGLEAAIDSTTTYASVTRGAATWFESYEVPVNDVIGYTSMMTAYIALKDNERGANPKLILAPWNQVQRLYNIQGQPAIKQIGPGDAAAGLADIAFAGVPIVGVPDMTDTTICFLDPGQGWWLVPVTRAMQVKQMGPSGDSDIWQVSSACSLVCKNPIKQGKLTGCTD